ncbi:MAG: hypothetical protein K9N55_04080 [Phycisphaerae bacterium]|nr:hypothetical protein [Phycisphaerae bacterium]
MRASCFDRGDIRLIDLPTFRADVISGKVIPVADMNTKTLGQICYSLLNS